jgi:hypothetical protein
MRLAILNVLKHKRNCYGHRGKTVKSKSCKFLLILSNLLASVDIIEFQITEAYSSLDLMRVKYNRYRHSMEEIGEGYIGNYTQQFNIFENVELT